MKNNYILALASAFFFFGSVGVKAQTILDEDFETENTDAENNITRPVAVEEGWTTIDSYSGSECVTNGLTIILTKAQLAASMLLCATVL